jgi:hypothetical protein
VEVYGVSAVPIVSTSDLTVGDISPETARLRPPIQGGHSPDRIGLLCLSADQVRRIQFVTFIGNGFRDGRA